MALTKITGEGVGDLDTLTVDGDVTLNDGSPNLRLKDTDTNRFVDLLYGTRVATFRNTMASGEDMDTVEPSMVFSFKDDGETRTAMTIDHDGYIHHNKTADDTSSGGLTIRNAHAECSQIRIVNDSGSSQYLHAYYGNSSNLVGSITNGHTGVAFNTSSDYRLKENVTYDWDATTRIKQLKPARFNFIADADTTVDGFLAHEAQTVVPEAITGTYNEVDDDGNPVYQGIDQSKLVPLLVKTIQELEARITALENV